MKRILLIAFVITAVVTWGDVRAQSRMVTGVVTTSKDSQPLPGVNIIVKGTVNGTVTDADGKYSIQVNSNDDALVFSFIGYVTKEVPVSGASTLNVSIDEDVHQLSEVVVTALGVKQEVKALPYAAQTVTAEKLTIARANNLNDALAGKVAGIQVRGQSGAALGREGAIRIRGAGSLTDRKPLYVVDGTPISSLDVDGPIDLNPDDVESINVLKGPSATAIYGQRGDAGVIMITTKKGLKNSGTGLTLSQNLFFDEIYILPEYQNSYAGGSFADLVQFNWQEGMPAEWQSLNGKYYHDYTDDASWGPRMVGQEYIPWYAWIPGTKYTGKTAKLLPQPDNIRDFYRTGVNSSTNVSFSQAVDNRSFRLSYTNQSVKGVIPNTDLNKHTVAANTTFTFGEKFTVGANVNFVSQIRNGEFNDDYSNQSSGSFNQWFHRNIDMNIVKELSNVRSPEGRLVSWNHFNPNYYLLNGDKFYRGNYWLSPASYFEQIDYKQNRDRLFGDVNVSYKITDHFNASVFYRKNQSTINWENKKPTILKYSYYYPELRPDDQDGYDYYGTGQTFSKEDNLEFLLSYNNRFFNDVLSVSLMGGGNIRKEKYQTLQGNTLDGLVVPDLFTLGNSVRQPFQSFNYRQRKEVRSLYARGNFGFRDIFFLDWSVRNDWSSALPVNNNSYLYPSIGASFVFSEFTTDALPQLSFGKLRASWAQVGSDLDPYQLNLLYTVSPNQWNGNIKSDVPNEMVDPNIKPALSSAFEGGIDLKFFENRIGLSATYFKENRKNEILSVNVTGASGYSTKKINAGRIERNAIELQLDATPVKMQNLSWDISVNWAKTRSKVVELIEGIDAIPLTDFNRLGGSRSNVSDAYALATVFNAVGQEWGQLRGLGIERHNGQRIVDENGLYVINESPQYLGSVLPDFTGGVINTVSYKDFVLTFNIDYQLGGKFFSLSDYYGTYSGLTKRTASLNDKGVPVRDPVEDGGGVRVTGVQRIAQLDGDGNPVLDESGNPVYTYQNYDSYVNAYDYYHQFTNNNVAEESIYDLSFVKLRELSLAYRIPVHKFGAVNKIVKSATFSLVGRNLWLIHSNVKDFDPSEISGQYGENGQFPGTRSYGFNLKVGF